LVTSPEIPFWNGPPQLAVLTPHAKNLSNLKKKMAGIETFVFPLNDKAGKAIKQANSETNGAVNAS
jgi:hypothetical protein